MLYISHEGHIIGFDMEIVIGAHGTLSTHRPDQAAPDNIQVGVLQRCSPQLQLVDYNAEELPINTTDLYYHTS